MLFVFYSLLPSVLFNSHGASADECVDRCNRLHIRTLQRVGLDDEKLAELLQKQRPLGTVKDACWRSYDKLDCMKKCPKSSEHEKFAKFITSKCRFVLENTIKGLQCVSKYHSFMEIRCSAFLNEATALRKKSDDEYTPDKETCRHLHLNALCLENAVAKHCPMAKRMFRRLNFRDYFLNFVLPKEDELFDDADLNSCQIYNFVKDNLALSSLEMEEELTTILNDLEEEEYESDTKETTMTSDITSSSGETITSEELTTLADFAEATSTTAVADDLKKMTPAQKLLPSSPASAVASTTSIELPASDRDEADHADFVTPTSSREDIAGLSSTRTILTVSTAGTGPMKTIIPFKYPVTTLAGGQKKPVKTTPAPTKTTTYKDVEIDDVDYANETPEIVNIVKIEKKNQSLDDIFDLGAMEDQIEEPETTAFDLPTEETFPDDMKKYTTTEIPITKPTESATESPDVLEHAATSSTGSSSSSPATTATSPQAVPTERITVTKYQLLTSTSRKPPSKKKTTVRLPLMTSLAGIPKVSRTTPSSRQDSSSPATSTPSKTGKTKKTPTGLTAVDMVKQEPFIRKSPEETTTVSFDDSEEEVVVSKTTSKKLFSEDSLENTPPNFHYSSLRYRTDWDEIGVRAVTLPGETFTSTRRDGMAYSEEEGEAVEINTLATARESSTSMEEIFIPTASTEVELLGTTQGHSILAVTTPDSVTSTEATTSESNPLLNEDDSSASDETTSMPHDAADEIGLMKTVAVRRFETSTALLDLKPLDEDSASGSTTSSFSNENDVTPLLAGQKIVVKQIRKFSEPDDDMNFHRQKNKQLHERSDEDLSARNETTLSPKSMVAQTHARILLFCILAGVAILSFIILFLCCLWCKKSTTVAKKYVVNE